MRSVPQDCSMNVALMFEVESVFVGGCGCRRGPSGVGEIF